MQKIRGQAHRMDHRKRASSGVLFAALHKPLVSHTDSMCFICAAPVTLSSQLRPFSGNNPHMFARIKSLSRQIIHLTIQEIGGSSYMKATGIVRRIDGSVIIGTSSESLKTLVFQWFCPISRAFNRRTWAQWTVTVYSEGRPKYRHVLCPATCYVGLRM